MAQYLNLCVTLPGEKEILATLYVARQNGTVCLHVDVLTLTDDRAAEVFFPCSRDDFSNSRVVK